ncbi:DUF397 domain-containing protein [Streptomyces sp. NPDC048196]|uniref:DUF397 domain-containing protein n=1 Tax=Streptomyces sp. NPDC048196 TaxID=3154712 RepID=UPI003409E2AA
MKPSNKLDLSSATWRRSSHSNPDGANCVEVRDDAPGLVPVRDSKDPHGPVLTFAGTHWSAFVDAVKDGTLGDA